ncbi:MAG: SlyX family protein [Mariprofundaceae bacterium]
MSDSKQEERMTELETKVAFQEYMLQQLNEVVIQQQDQLEDLVLQIKGLQQHAETIADGATHGNEKPPHY